MRYTTIGQASARPPDLLSCYPSHQRPSFSGIQELAGRGRSHTTDGDIVLLVRNPTPPPTPDEPSLVGRAACLLNDDPIRIYVPILMRPWIMQACHSTASCHLGHHAHIGHDGVVILVDRHERVHPVVASALFKVPSAQNLTTDCPLANHLHASPGSPGIAISVGYFGPLPVTPGGNTYILLITDRFSRRADMFSVTTAVFTAEGTANILVYQYIL